MTFIASMILWVVSCDPRGCTAAQSMQLAGPSSAVLCARIAQGLGPGTRRSFARNGMTGRYECLPPGVYPNNVTIGRL